MMKRITLALLCCCWLTGTWARGVYQEPADFIAETFSGSSPAAAVLWLTGERKAVIHDILGHNYASLRVRYWQQGERSAWILDEIGKEHPITTGIVVNAGKIERVKVLVFRESRGWEVRHSFFTDQFEAASLDTQMELNRHIDNISGATLSVRALKKLARMALYLAQQLQAQDVTPSP